ncbi:restriction endonuclease subunit S [Trichocoleus sp. ST-U3]
MNEDTKSLPALPHGWAWTTTENLSSFENNAICAGPFGTIFKAKDFRDSGIPIIFLRHVAPGQYLTHKPGFMDVDKWEEMFKEYSVFGGELLVTKLGEPPGVCAIYPEGVGPAMVTPDVIKMTVNKDVTEAKYLMHYFNSEGARKFAFGIAYGATRLRMNLPIFRQLSIPLAPLNEQRRIVAKIEGLKARSQRVKEELEAIPTLLDQFRQSVLTAAFRGDLTADWREKNPDIEPASVLLERIRAEHRRRWEEAELEKMKAQGKMPKDDKWKEKYKEPKHVDTNNLPELPDGWRWIAVEEFADVGTGATPLRNEQKYYECGTIPWVTSGALNEPFISTAEEYITALAIKETNAKIFPRYTLLVAMYGEGKTRGKVSELVIEAATNQACAALILEGIAAKIRPTVKLFFQKNYSDLRRLASGGVQPNLNLSMIKVTAVPLPPLEEQTEIIRAVARCMLIADAVEKQYLESIELIKHLDQSILAKAFRGALVPQNPNDEPASVLLERIRAEREKLDTKKKAKGKSEKESRKAKPEAAELEQMSLPGFE